MIRKWLIRQSSTTQCSPALGIFACMVILGITAYHFRNLIIETLVAVLIIVGIAGAASVVVFLAVNTIRWQRRRAAAELKDEEKAMAIVPQPDKGIGSAAEMLADDNVVLAWTPDGKSLEAHKL